MDLFSNDADCLVKSAPIYYFILSTNVETKQHEAVEIHPTIEQPKSEETRKLLDVEENAAAKAPTEKR